MSTLYFHAHKNDLNKILRGEVVMPNFNAILQEKVKVYAQLDSNEEVSRVLLDPEEPLNIRFRMDQIDEKIPNYVNMDERILLDKVYARCLNVDIESPKISEHSLNVNLTVENDQILYGSFEKNFEKQSIINGNWRALFTHSDKNVKLGFRLPQMNSIIINDNYLFNNNRNKINLGILNVINLLTAIMPESCSVEFHFTIITSEVNWNFEYAKINFNLMKKELEQKFSYPIFFELVICKTPDNHKRLLISNYFMATADKGFDVFDENDKVIQANDILVRRIFHDVRQPGESPYQQSNVRLKMLNKTYDSTKEFVLNREPMLGRIYLSNDENNLKKNRLLI